MITKNQIKHIQQLHHKKGRQAEQLFLVEGAKNVLELLQSDFNIHALYTTAHFYQENLKLLQNSQIQAIEIENSQLERISTLESNNAALAVVQTKANQHLLAEQEWVLVLDDIKDPGNLGTIIRIADWYGIKKIVASEQSVELYNPKVIAATMGSFTRVALYYCDIATYMQALPKAHFYGAVMNGSSIYQQKFGKEGYLVIGNESHGISATIQNMLSAKITIPGRGGAESLNAAIATAIILDNVFRAN